MKWKHNTNKCTKTECFCLNPEIPDPICDCGNPGWACACYDGRFDEDEDEDLLDKSQERLTLSP
jgi:hypothetical protein